MNERDGGIKTALGLQPNIADLLLVVDGEVWGIEIKHVDTEHITKHISGQCRWLMSVPKRGFFCDSLEDFKSIVLTGKGGVDPRTVLKNLEEISTSSVSWDKIRS